MADALYGYSLGGLRWDIWRMETRTKGLGWNPKSNNIAPAPAAPPWIDRALIASALRTARAEAEVRAWREQQG